MLPAALLCAVAGMMLAFLTPRQAAFGVLTLIAVAVLAGTIPLPAAFAEIALAGCWASLLACALCVFWPGVPASWMVLAIAANAGLWAGLVTATEAKPGDLWRALAAVLLVIPAAWAVRRGYAVAPKVVTSWLVAVAVIAAFLPIVTVHPGYLDDHRE